MNSYDKKIFLLKKGLYQHSFGVCSRLNIPYSRLRRSYYRFITRQLLPILDSAYCEALKSKVEKVEPELDRKVWVMWWQGIDKAPKIVKHNIKIMKEIFGSRVKVISKDNLANYIDISPVLKRKFKDNVIPQALWSDIVRISLLNKYGGLWIDSTVVMSNKILEFPKLFDRSFVSICSSVGSDINISREEWTTWFIGGKAQAPIFKFLSAFFIKYYSNFNFILDYFLFDYAVRFFYEKNSEFRREIESQKREWHVLYFYDNLYNSAKEVDFKKFNNNLKYCIQKVTYRVNKEKLHSNSLFNYILNYKFEG